MKTFKIFGFVLAASALLTSCVGDDDTTLPNYTPYLIGEDFTGPADNTILEIEGWQNVASQGTAVWKNQIFSGNNYAEFSSFQSGEAVNVGWLITPGVNLDATEGEVLGFDVSQSFVSDAANKLEVLVSTDYDGNAANIATATWQPLNANIPGPSAVYFEFQESGAIDLSSYTGTAYIAFRVTGSGTNSSLDGSYQIDNVRISYQN